MISYLKGKILLKDSDYIILEVNSVGYKVFVSESMLAQVTEERGDFEVFCFLKIRKDDTIELYGLPTFEALKLFEMFCDVSGIGPKAGLLLSSLGSPEEIRKAIESRSTEFFSGVKGIGYKKVQKIILELTGKLEDFDSQKVSARDDVVDSLVGLGFSRIEARDAVSRLPSDVIQPEDRIKEALKLLGRR